MLVSTPCWARPLAAAVCVATLAVACTAEPSRLAEPPPAPRLEPPAPRALGVKWDWSRFDVVEPYVEALGGGITWHEVVWCNVEPEPAVQDWEFVDDVVERSNRLGFEVRLKLRVGSCWATGRRLEERGRAATTASLMPLDIDRYRQFVRRAVNRYSDAGVGVYAVENEVNSPSFWAASADDYVDLARVAAETIRETDPSATVVDSGISSTGLGVGIALRLLDRGQPRAAVDAYRRYYARRFAVRGDDFPEVDDEAELRDALGGAQPRRNLEFLEATMRLAHDGVVDAYQLHFYERWDNVPALMAYLEAELPSNVPVDAWEVGMFWPGAPHEDDALLAAEAAKTVILLLGAGARSVIWLPGAHNPDSERFDDETLFGLVEPDGAIRPLGHAFARVAEAAAGLAAGATTVEMVSERPDVLAAAFVSGDVADVVAWNVDDHDRVVGSLPVGARVTRLVDGEPVAVVDTSVTLGAAPLLIRLPAGGLPAADALL